MSRQPRAILFNPATWRGVGDATAPWGLISLATFLKPQIDVVLIDQRFDRNWKQVVRRLLAKGDVLFAGATGMTGLQLKGMLEFMRFVKSVSTVPTVLGGVHASMLPLETVAHDAIDYVVVGEAEFVVSQLAAAFERGQRPEKIGKNSGMGPVGQGKDLFDNAVVWKGKKEYSHAIVEDLDSLPLPPYRHFPMKRYIGRSPYGRMLSIVTSRGCPHGCAFCVHSNRRLSKRWRAMSAERAVEFMSALAREYSVEHFHIQDDNFFVRTSRVEEFVSRLLQADPGFTWTVGGAHVMHLKEYPLDFFRAMRRAGCVRLLIGAESGSERILERIGKKQSTGEVLLVNRLLGLAGIRPIFSFISGVPGEEVEDLKKTVDLMAALRSQRKAVDVGTIKPLVYYPGTEFYSWAVKNGFLPPRTVEGWCGVSWDNYMELPYPWLSPERKSFLIQLYYTSLMWNPDYHWVSSPLFTSFARGMMPVTRWRMTHLNFNCSVVPGLLKWIQHRLFS